MLKPDPYSDISELCRWTEMNPAHYRRFESLLTFDNTEQTEIPVSSVDDRNQPLAEPKISSTNFQPAIAVHADCAPLTVSSPPIQHQLIALASVHGQATAEPNVLPLLSGVGGCGVTTILSTLGRALSILGQRVLLVDTEGPSTLQSSYKTQAEGSGLLLSTDPLSRFEGQVHVLRTSPTYTPSAQGVSTRFYRAMAELAGRLDHVILAGDKLLTPALKGQNPAKRNVCLVVITAEMRSTLAAPDILASFAGDADPWFLLNRFDKHNSRNVQCRLQLESSLGNRLLPFHIPESSSVEAALLRGVTLLDLEPQSEIADAFFNLAEWYRAMCEVKTSSHCFSEETQLAVSNR